MKKLNIIGSLIILFVLIPSVAFAAWWNPTTWFNDWSSSSNLNITSLASTSIATTSIFLKQSNITSVASTSSVTTATSTGAVLVIKQAVNKVTVTAVASQTSNICPHGYTCTPLNATLVTPSQTAVPSTLTSAQQSSAEQEANEAGIEAINNAAAQQAQTAASAATQLNDDSSQMTADVVYEKSGCDYFIVYDNTNSYDLLEWFGGYSPDQDDTLVGNFDQYGFHDFYDSSAEASTHLWIEDYLLTSDDAVNQYQEKCNDVVTSASYDNSTYTNLYGDTINSPYTSNSEGDSYTNVDGNDVPAPAYSEDGGIPNGATAQCSDGTYSFSQNHSGTCSYHDGVEEWLH